MSDKKESPRFLLVDESGGVTTADHADTQLYAADTGQVCIDLHERVVHAPDKCAFPELAGADDDVADWVADGGKDNIEVEDEDED
jgi:hypothetical protein